jgi:hypothetical protein
VKAQHAGETLIQPIRICGIGCIIAAHASLSTVAAYFLDDPRAQEKRKTR